MASERYEKMIRDRVDFLYARVEKLQNFLNSSEEVLMSMIDGIQTQFDRSGARKELKECMDELTRLEGQRPSMYDMTFEGKQ